MKYRFLSILLAGLIWSVIATSSNGFATAAAGNDALGTLSKSSSKAKPAKLSRTVRKAASRPSPRPIADAALRRMFRGRTWLWADGAAYFAPDGRFAAWAGRSAKASYAYGSWRTRPNGRLCFRANWVSRAGSGRAESCFAHRSRSGDILQRKEPKGKWYVFKHRKTRASDEFRKLVSGDRAGARAKRIETRLSGRRT
jgi:hypothetical protein